MLVMHFAYVKQSANLVKILNLNIIIFNLIDN